MVNYKAIADEVDSIGYPDYETAYTTMSVETTVSYKSLSGNELRIWAASNTADYETLKENTDPLSEIALKLIDSPDSTLDMSNDAIQGFVANLPISDPGRLAIFTMSATNQNKWPGLKPGHVQNAMQKRQAGKI